MSYDRSPLTLAEIEDLDLDALDGFVTRRAPDLRQALSLNAAAQRLGLLGKTAGRQVPTPTGQLLFGQRPQLAFPEWGVLVLRIDGTVLADPIAARVDLEGSLPGLLEQTLSFVGDNSRTITNQVEPTDVADEYPAIAVREAVLNALIHRDLRKAGRVAVRMFDDRLEIWSPGGPPESVGDLSELAEQGGVSLPRNGLLAATARMLGLGEQVGRGLTIMRRAMADLPHQPLQVLTSPKDVLVVLPSRLRGPSRAGQLS